MDDPRAYVGHDLTTVFGELVEIHTAPPWLWPALVEHLVSEGLTVEAMKQPISAVLSVKSGHFPQLRPDGT